MDGMIIITRALAIPNFHGVVGGVVAAYLFVCFTSFISRPPAMKLVAQTRPTRWENLFLLSPPTLNQDSPVRGELN